MKKELTTEEYLRVIKLINSLYKDRTETEQGEVLVSLSMLLCDKVVDFYENLADINPADKNQIWQ